MGGVKITILFIVKKINSLLDLYGGETGIRTLGRLAPTTVFEIEAGGAIRLLLILGCVV